MTKASVLSRPMKAGKEFFVHITALRNRQNKPQINQPVSYNLSQDKQGRPCAANVSRAGDAPAQGKNVNKGSNANIAAALFLTIVCISTLMAKIPFFTTLPFSKHAHFCCLCERQISRKKRKMANVRKYFTLFGTSLRVARRTHCSRTVAP